MTSSPEGRQEAVVLDAKALHKLQLWFFRDISDEERLSLFSIFGMPVDEIGKVHGHQRHALNHILRALIPAKPAVEVVEALNAPELIERLRGPVFGTPTALAAAAAIETWKARAERLADMHRDMCVVAGEAIARAERAEAALQAPATPDALPASKEAEASEGEQIADAVLAWMVKFDLLDAGNEYRAEDVVAVLNDLAPAAHPPTDAGVSEALVPRVWGDRGELAMEWVGRAVISIDADGASYAIASGNRWRGGEFSIADEPVKASEEINAALSTAIPAGDGVTTGMVLVLWADAGGWVKDLGLEQGKRMMIREEDFWDFIRALSTTSTSGKG